MDNTNIQAYCETRLKRMMIKDKQDNPQKISNILKAEILYVLKSYLEVNDYDMDLEITITKEGRYHINIQADCRNIKSVSYIS